MKRDFVMPILVLALICLVIAAALAFTNSVTEPIIADAAAQREDDARYEIIPEAVGFEIVAVEGLPESVIEVLKSTNDVGYVFVMKVSGYGGDMKIICGVRPDGSVIAAKALEQSETKGLGSKITEEPFSGQFNGIGIEKIDGIVAISGATKSSEAYKGAIRDALYAFSAIGK